MSSRLATFPNASAQAITPDGSLPFRGSVDPWQRGTWRCGRSLVFQQSLPLGITWSLAIACAFLTIGGAGLRDPIPSIEHLQLSGKPGAADASDDDNENEAAMVEMTTPAELTHASTPDQPIETPQIWEPQDLPQAADQPPLVEALDSADLFAVPVAAAIEPALTPDQPKPEKRPAPTPTTASSRSTTSTSGTPGTSTTSSNGGSGNGKVGSGGKGKFPSPPYPSFARSRGMQGTTYLSIRVGAGGTVESVSVSSSSGYSDLDSYASSWVRKYWRWPAGSARSYRQPFVFRLR
jgi:periplasmic protein TonB